MKITFWKKYHLATLKTHNKGFVLQTVFAFKQTASFKLVWPLYYIALAIGTKYFGHSLFLYILSILWYVFWQSGKFICQHFTASSKLVKYWHYYGSWRSVQKDWGWNAESFSDFLSREKRFYFYQKPRVSGSLVYFHSLKGKH